VLIAVDIDSTLHHYWEQFALIARGRFGVELPYEHQHTWAIPRLKDEQIRWCVEQTHREEHVLAAEPYPGSVEAINRWVAMGHVVHITSHRAVDAHDVTGRWLERIGLHYSSLYCVQDKVPLCLGLGVDLLIDDSPDNLERALAQNIAGATIQHPWNVEFCETEDVTSAPDWPSLEQALAPQLAVV